MEQQVREFESLAELLEDLDREGITGQQRKYLADQFMIMRARIKRKPYTASFELTPLCNFNCKMCYVHLSLEQLNDKQQILSTEEWIEIMQSAIDAGVMHVDLTGGECLLHPGFKRIYVFLVTHGVNVAVLTNGQLVTEDIIELFRRYPPANVQITLYGSNEEAYRRVTGREAFADVINAITKLKSAKINIRLVITPNRYMQDDTADLLGFVRTLGVQYDIGTAMLPPRPETEREYADVVMDIERYVGLVQQESRLRAGTENVASHHREYRFRVKGMEQVSGLPCAAGTGAFHVNWKGEMTPCIPLYTIAHSVLNGQFQQAWDWIANRVAMYTVPEKCLSCEYVKVCNTCTAEKTTCELGGNVNSYVCERIKRMTQAGLVKMSVPSCE